VATRVWKGNLIAGDVRIPAKLVAAARKHASELCQVHETDCSPAKQVLFCAAEEKPIPRSEVAKGFEYEPGRFLKLNEEDLKAINAKPGDMELFRFVAPDEIDLRHIESSYYVLPDGDESLYAALGRALIRTASIALGQIVLYGQERTAMIRPGHSGLVLFTLFCDDELRLLDEFRTDTESADERDIRDFSALMRSRRGLEPGFTIQNPYRERLRQLVEAQVLKMIPQKTDRSELRSGASAKAS